jgi:zinc protease
MTASIPLVVPVRLQALVGALSLLACVPGTPPLPSAPILAARILPQVDLQLPSGLRVIIQEDHAVPLVTVAAIYGSGATADPRGAEGLAHLVEHLTFRARDGGKSRIERLKRTGAVSFNASTGADTTTYHAVVHSDALEEALAVEISRLRQPLLDLTDDDLEVERRVVINEHHQRQATAGTDARLVMAWMFPPEHPLAHLQGDASSLARLDLAQAREFVDRHYLPENCTLVISGDVQSARLAAELKDSPVAAPPASGRPWSHRAPRAATAVVPSPVLRPDSWVKSRTAHGHRRMVISWSLPGVTAKNEAQLWLVEAVVGGLVARFDADVDVVQMADASILFVSVPLQAEEPVPEVRDLVLQVLTGGGINELSWKLVPRLRRRASVNLMVRLSDPLVSAQELMRHVAVTGRPDLQKDIIYELRLVGADAVAKLITSYVRAERAVTVLLESDAWQARGTEPVARDVEERVLARGAVEDLAGMGPEDVLRVAHAPGLGNQPRFELANGLEVVAVARKSEPLARIDLQLPGGSATDAPFADLAAATSSVSCEPEVPLADVGGRMRTAHDGFDSEISVVVPSENLVNGAANLADNVRCRGLDWNVAQALAGIAKKRQKLLDVEGDSALREFWWTLYRDHPFGRSAVDLATLGPVVPELARSYVDAHFRPNRALAVVVSPRTTAEISALMKERFGRWQRRVGPPRPPSLTPMSPIPPQRTLGVYARPGHDQVSVIVGCRLGAAAEQEPALDVLEKVVDEQAWQLREQWGATYGLGVYVGRIPGSAHLIVQGMVETPKVGRVLSTLLGQLDTVATAGPDERTLTVARWEVARGFDLRFATGEGMSQGIRYAARQGWSAAEWDRYPERLAAVDAAQLQALMQSCARHEVIILRGDVPSIEAQLKGVGLRR